MGQADKTPKTLAITAKTAASFYGNNTDDNDDDKSHEGAVSSKRTALNCCVCLNAKQF